MNSKLSPLSPLTTISAIMLIIFSVLFAGSKLLANENESETNSTIWLARSCIGEAGFDSINTGECAAILHVYKKRAHMGNKTTLWIAQRYSSAIKRGGHHLNKWVRHLNAKATRPRFWPSGAKWERHINKWLATIEYVKRFEDNEIEDPVPRAIHYGSPIDPPVSSMIRIKTKFKNRFYRVRGVKI